MKSDTKSAVLEAENSDLKAEIEELKQQVQLLTEQLRLTQHRQFGPSSEKTPPEQLSLFDEAEMEAKPDAPEPELEKIAYTRKKRVGKRDEDFSGLPTEQIVHELPENERVCPDCGGAMHNCGHDLLRRELVVIPAKYVVREHVQTVYSCRHCEQTSDHVPMKKASVPAPVIPKSGVCSPSLLAYIASQKYVLALPLYRQEQEFARNQIHISRQNMANWVIYGATHWLMPLYERLHKALLAHDIAHADETVVQVLKEPLPKKDNRMWMYRTSGDAAHPIVLYDYQANRCAENAEKFLAGFAGYLHTDGYSGYRKLQNVTVVGCWAHVRRKFTDALKSLADYNREGSIAMQGKLFCDKLFALEREYAKLSPDENCTARLAARLEKSKPVMDDFFAWARSANCLLPKSPTGKALLYAQNQQFYLEKVLLDGRLELSNNRAERSIKPFVIGRKNWLFSNTPGGAKASAAFYSIIETAKENNLKPFEYLEFIFRTVPNPDFGQQPDLLDQLLPWNAPPTCRCAAKPGAVAHAWDEQ
jgi:transposase